MTLKTRSLRPPTKRSPCDNLLAAGNGWMKKGDIILSCHFPETSCLTSSSAKSRILSQCCQVGNFIAKFDQSWLIRTPFGKIYFQLFSVFAEFLSSLSRYCLANFGPHLVKSVQIEKKTFRLSGFFGPGNTVLSVCHYGDRP